MIRTLTEISSVLSIMSASGAADASEIQMKTIDIGNGLDRGYAVGGIDGLFRRAPGYLIKPEEALT